MNVRELLNPKQQPVPPVLFKYLRPGRFDVLANCRLRFTQRLLFEDDHELQPDYASYGTAEEIECQLRQIGLEIPDIPLKEHARLIAGNPQHQQKALKTAVTNIKSIDEMGILCLTMNGNSEPMWKEYADNGAGFVIGFDTTHADFGKLTAPLGIIPVVYSDEVFESFLGMTKKNVFEPLYRKRMAYSYEEEWRSIRKLSDLEQHPGDVFLSSFDPASVCQIIIHAGCVLGPQLQNLVAQDERYRHVEILEK